MPDSDLRGQQGGWRRKGWKLNLECVRCIYRSSYAVWIELRLAASTQLLVVSTAPSCFQSMSPSDMSEKLSKLSVVQMSGQVLEVDVASLPDDCRVHDLKRHLSSKLSCPTFRLTLLNGGTVLKNHDSWQAIGNPMTLSVVQASPAASWVHDYWDELLEAVSGDDILGVDEALAKGQSPDTLAFGGETVLFAAARNGFLDVARSLVDAGASLHHRFRGVFTPLYIASWQGHLEVVRLFVDAGADPNQGLCAAAFRGHAAVVQFLLNRGADVNAPDEHDQLPAEIACAEGHLEVTRLLLHAQAGLGQDLQPERLLHAAVSGGHIEVARLLLQVGADVHEANANSDSPMEAARRGGDLEMIELLESASDVSDVSVPGQCHNRPCLHLNPMFQERQVWMNSF